MGLRTASKIASVSTVKKVYKIAIHTGILFKIGYRCNFGSDFWCDLFATEHGNKPPDNIGGAPWASLSTSQLSRTPVPLPWNGGNTHQSARPCRAWHSISLFVEPDAALALSPVNFSGPSNSTYVGPSRDVKILHCAYSLTVMKREIELKGSTTSQSAI